MPATFINDYAIIIVGLVLLLLGWRLLRRLADERAVFGGELCLFVSAYLFYFLVRGGVKGRSALAYANGDRIIRLEQRLGIFWEQSLQRHALDAGSLVIDMANWAYVWLFWPVLFTTLIWLFLRHHESYGIYRNAMLLSGAIGLVIFASFPVAPPRLMDGLGFSDTVGTRSLVFNVLFPSSLANPYAAMPSLHEGWTLLMGQAIYRHGSSCRWRAFGLILPGLMFASIVATANHYFVDALVGGAIATLGFAVASYWRHRSRSPRSARTLAAAHLRPGAGRPSHRRRTAVEFHGAYSALEAGSDID